MQSHSKQQQNRKWLGRVSVHIIRKFQRLKRRPGAASGSGELTRTRERLHHFLRKPGLGRACPVAPGRGFAGREGPARPHRGPPPAADPRVLRHRTATPPPSERPGPATRAERPEREQAAAPRPVSRRGMRARPFPDNQPRARAADTKPALRPRAPVTTHRGVSPRPPGRGRSQLPRRRTRSAAATAAARARPPACLHSLSGPRDASRAPDWRFAGGRYGRSRTRAGVGFGGWNAAAAAPASLAQLHSAGGGGPAEGAGRRGGPGAWAGPGAHATSAGVASRLRPPPRSRAHAPSVSSDTPLRGGVGNP